MGLLAAACGGLCGLGAGLSVRLRDARRVLLAAAQDLCDDLERDRRVTQGLKAAVDDVLERAVSKERRIAGAKGGSGSSSSAEDHTTVATTRDEYRAWLEKGGARHPDTERSLGLGE